MLRVALFGVILLAGCLMFSTTVMGGTWIVDDDNGSWRNASSIQEAINSSSSGDKIRVFAGTYSEDITIDKSISVIGNSSINTTISGSGSDTVVTISASWVNLSGLHIKDGDNGVNVSQSDNVTIEDNWISDNDGVGLYIDTSNDTGIISNNISYNTDHGIEIKYSPRNNISRNHISWNDQWGIDSVRANDTIVSNNNLTWNGRYGMEFVFSNNLIIKWNNVSRSGRKLFESPYGIGISINSGSNATILQNNCTINDGNAIRIAQLTNSRILMNNLSDGRGNGIACSNVQYVMIDNNSINNMTHLGIHMSSTSNNNTIQYNEIWDYGQDHWAISLSINTENITVHHNNIAGYRSDSHAYDDSGKNQWSDGSFGNYWSNWNGSGNYTIDGIGGGVDENPTDETVETSAPEKVPEFGLLIPMMLLCMFGVFYRRLR